MMAGRNLTHVDLNERDQDDIRFLEEFDQVQHYLAEQGFGEEYEEEEEDDQVQLYLAEQGFGEEYEEEGELFDQVQQYLAEQGFGEEYEEEEEEEDDDDDDEDDDDQDEDYSPGGEEEGSRNRHSTSSAQRTTIVNEGEETAEDKPASSQNVSGNEVGNMGELNQSEVDGLFCPICIEAWTDEGDHRICCLPCGHIYGMSCIKKWFQQCGRSSGKCPQCNRRCMLKDVRKLYASRLVVVDEGLRKKLWTLEAKCASLEKKDAEWSKKEAEWRERELCLNQEAVQLTEF